ncbi:unnamed protein product [Discula destructiva]
MDICKTSRYVWATALLLTIRPDAVQGSAIASWWVDTDASYAPQIFQYNATNNTIYASLCNSLDAPIFARNDSAALETTIAPLANTSITSLGYLSASSTLETNVFYLANLADDNAGPTIASASYTCNATTGRWTPSAPATYISNGTNCGLSAAPAIDAAGGLAALYLSDDDGMRVFFKTAEFQTHYLQYLPSGAACSGWSYAGIASNLSTGHAVAAGFLSAKPAVWSLAQTVFANESAAVAAAADAAAGGQIELSTSDAHGVADLWSINRMPTQIIAQLKADNSTAGILSNMSTTADSEWDFVSTDAWDGLTFSSFSGTSSRIGLAVDSGGIPSVFYVGTDGYLRRFSADTNGHWHADSTMDETKWPPADTTDDYADFGLAYDTDGNRIWIFYEVDGQMAQVYQSGTSAWEDFSTLATYNASLAATPSSSESGSESTASSSEPSSYNSSSTSSSSVGFGVGLGLGIPLVCGAIALLFFLRRRRRRQQRRSSPVQPLSDQIGRHSPVSPMTDYSISQAPPLDQNQGYWLDGVWVQKTVTEYYAGGAGPGAGHVRQPLGELDVAGHKDPVYEMEGMKRAQYELP